MSQRDPPINLDGNADDSGPKRGSVVSPLMSPHNDREDGLDPSTFVLSQTSRAPTGGRRGRGISPVQGKFIAGPVDVSWFAAARKLGVTPLWVGLYLWFLRGLRKSNSFIVSNMMMREWDVSPDAKARALRKLATAGLIILEARRKRNPRVTLAIPKAAETSVLHYRHANNCDGSSPPIHSRRRYQK
jgi:hypothetical protein